MAAPGSPPGSPPPAAPAAGGSPLPGQPPNGRSAFRASLVGCIDEEIAVTKQQLTVLKAQVKKKATDMRNLKKRKARMLKATGGLSSADLALLAVARMSN